MAEHEGMKTKLFQTTLLITFSLILTSCLDPQTPQVPQGRDCSARALIAVYDLLKIKGIPDGSPMRLLHNEQIVHSTCPTDPPASESLIVTTPIDDDTLLYSSLDLESSAVRLLTYDDADCTQNEVERLSVEIPEVSESERYQSCSFYPKSAIFEYEL